MQDLETNTILLLIITAIGLFTAVVSWTNKREIASQSARSIENSTNIKKIELTTNNLQTVLLASTAKSSHAEGKEEGRIEEKMHGIASGPTHSTHALTPIQPAPAAPVQVSIEKSVPLEIKK